MSRIARCDAELARLEREACKPNALGEFQGVLLAITDWSNEKRFLMSTPKSDEALTQWPSFIAEIRQRLESGKRTYGDSSFERPLLRLATEIQQELEDQAGWSFIQWARIEALKPKIEELERSLQCAAETSSSPSPAGAPSTGSA